MAAASWDDFRMNLEAYSESGEFGRIAPAVASARRLLNQLDAHTAVLPLEITRGMVAGELAQLLLDQTEIDLDLGLAVEAADLAESLLPSSPFRTAGDLEYVALFVNARHRLAVLQADPRPVVRTLPLLIRLVRNVPPEFRRRRRCC